jgi:micrococcal nuclease
LTYHGILVVAMMFLSVARPASAAPMTLHFTFGLTRQVDACWEEGDRLKYRVGGQSYEIAKTEVARIDGTCGSAPPVTAGLRAPPSTSPALPLPTDAMLAAGRATLPPPSWSPPSGGRCSTRGIDVALRRVVDGDTIEVRMPGGQIEAVRYIGMNTPEVHHPDKGEEPGGQVAKALNETLVTGKRLELVFDAQARDRYGRLLAYVYANGEHVNAALVERGYAAAATYPPNVCFADRFRSLERHARNGRRGLWGEPGPEATLVAAREVNVTPEVDDGPSSLISSSAVYPSPAGKSGNNGPVQVRGYTRKDGTVVAPHTRSTPGTRSGARR